MDKIEYGAPTQDETFDELNVQEIVLAMLAERVLDDRAVAHVSSEYERKGYIHRREVSAKTDHLSDDEVIISLEIVVSARDFVKSELATQLYGILELRKAAQVQLATVAREAKITALEAELAALRK
jgi:hypothetical protein